MLAPNTARFTKDFDWVLLVTALFLAGFGVVQISSAQPTPGFWQRQLVAVLIGLGVMVAVALFDYNKIVYASPALYAVGLVLLVAVLMFGREINGNKNWLQIGPVSLQPSELAKIFTLLFLTRYLSNVRELPLKLRTVLIVGGMWVAPAALVMLGKDLGSTLSYAALFGTLLFMAGISWRWLAVGVAAVALVGALAVPYVKACKSYKCERIKAVYWPDLAEKRFRYQNEQSQIAVGSGGIVGKGIHSGTQGPLGFVPEVHSDFIFALAGEETGFVGSILALAAYLIVITRLIQIARQARDRTGMLLVAGFAGLILYHVAVSVGMVLGLLPIMGIPLPLMSSGGSSVVATLFALGLAFSVRLRRFVN
jgi:rod shape determining protein RodA